VQGPNSQRSVVRTRQRRCPGIALHNMAVTFPSDVTRSWKEAEIRQGEILRNFFSSLREPHSPDEQPS
jgi:hypothetical protein